MADKARTSELSSPGRVFSLGFLWGPRLVEQVSSSWGPYQGDGLTGLLPGDRPLFLLQHFVPCLCFPHRTGSGLEVKP